MCLARVTSHAFIVDAIIAIAMLMLSRCGCPIIPDPTAMAAIAIFAMMYYRQWYRYYNTLSAHTYIEYQKWWYL